jgi:tRNA(Ile)-lysidine synthase
MWASNIGCDDEMNWIQINPQLLGSFPPDSRHLVGVSGGRDSIVLLHYLFNLGYRKLIVCHLNHQLRGQSSQADSRFVEKLVATWNKKSVADIDFESGSADVRARAKRKKTSIEAAAREARYSFFAGVAKRRRCHTIFLAHHADDLVETLLINLFRGAGATGLAAMREASTRRIEGVDLTIVRPLLSVWRDEIDTYVREHRLKFREDTSNKDLAPLRNRIRGRIIPYLEKTLGRSIRQNIWRTAVIAAEEEYWIESQLPNATGTDFSVEELRKLPVAFQRRQILKWLRAREVANVGFDVIERIRSLLPPGSRTAKTNLPKNRHVRRRAGRLFLDM